MRNSAVAVGSLALRPSAKTAEKEQKRRTVASYEQACVLGTWTVGVRTDCAVKARARVIGYAELTVPP
jgi:hypothetical protein